MASASPDTDRNRRRTEAETAALALFLTSRKRYDLPAIIKANGIKPKRFGHIRPTATLATDLALPYLALVGLWRDRTPQLLDAYRRAILTRDASGIRAALAGIVSDAELAAFRQRLGLAVDRIERWHRSQWIAKVRSATGVDVSLFSSAAEVRPETTAATAWNEALLGDVHEQTKGRVSSALLAGIAVAAPAKEVARGIADAVGKARIRSKNIAVDQVEKASAGMTRGRRQSAGIGLWRWRHYDPQPYPRPAHVARDGMVFSDTRPPPEQPSELPYCKCWAEPLFDLS